MLIETHKVPICIINGAQGGTRIDQHQRNEADPTDVSTIYGRLLWRLQQAKLTHGVRAVLWHQGENDMFEKNYMPKDRIISVSEAMMLMNLNDQSAIFFKNSQTKRLNILFKRSDGNIGWLDPKK